MATIVDQIHLIAEAGSGGNGCASFFVRQDRKRIPNGGDGGQGGSVIFRADHNAPPLESLKFKQRLVAESGTHGGSNRKTGKDGKDLVVLIPVGTRIRDRKKNFLIRDMTHEGEEVVIVQGGCSGSGNFGDKESTRGEKGEVLDLELSIRIVADVFLIGLPNSGKSRILNCLTRARTKEEDYPFATKSPVMGVYLISDYERLTLCELPSLYRASCEGRGLGTDYLKHLERSKYILYVVDVFSRFATNFREGFEILRDQVGQQCPGFLDIPYAVVVNKIDLENNRDIMDSPQQDFNALTFFVSAKTGEGMDDLKKHLETIYQKGVEGEVESS